MKIIIDLDKTITAPQQDSNYTDVLPDIDVIKRLQEYREKGFGITIYTARNMQTYKGDIGKINVNTLPNIIEWLDKHNIPYDEIIVGKPWCEEGGFYVDDKAIRPDEFKNLSVEQIYKLVNN